MGLCPTTINKEFGQQELSLATIKLCAGKPAYKNTKNLGNRTTPGYNKIRRRWKPAKLQGNSRYFYGSYAQLQTTRNLVNRTSLATIEVELTNYEVILVKYFMGLGPINKEIWATGLSLATIRLGTKHRN